MALDALTIATLGLLSGDSYLVSVEGLGDFSSSDGIYGVGGSEVVDLFVFNQVESPYIVYERTS